MKIIKILTLSLIFFGWINYSHAQIDYTSFKGEKVKTNLEFNLENSYFKQYGSEFMQKYEEFEKRNKSNDLSSPENTLLSYYSATNKNDYKKLFKNKAIKISNNELEKRQESDTLQSKIRLMHRLTFDYQNKTFTFFKYMLLKDSVSSLPLLLVMEKSSDNSWKILVKSDFENTEYAIKHLKSRAFWEFFNRQDDVDYPEINKLKPKVQDANGILNIEKLGQVVKANKSALIKYID